jgi:hypothetical protein
MEVEYDQSVLCASELLHGKKKRISKWEPNEGTVLH